MKALSTKMFTIHDCGGRWMEFGGGIFDIPLFSISV